MVSATDFSTSGNTHHSVKFTAQQLNEHGGLGKVEGRKALATHNGGLYSIESSPQSIRHAKKTASAFVDILKNSPGVKIGLACLAAAAVIAIITSSFGVGVLAVPLLVGVLNILGIAGGLSIAGGLAWDGGKAALDKDSKLRKLPDAGARFELAPATPSADQPKSVLVNYADALVAAKPSNHTALEADDPFTNLKTTRDALNDAPANTDEAQLKNQLLAAIAAAQLAFIANGNPNQENDVHVSGQQ